MKKKTKKKRKNKKVNKDSNPQWFVCGGTMIPPHGLDIVIIFINILTLSLKKSN